MIKFHNEWLKIVDIFNPERPIEVAAFDTYPLNNDGGYYGCWGAYPFTANNYIYASDMQNGLYIFNFEEVFAGYVNGTLYYQNSPLINTNIKSQLNNKIYTTDQNGFFDFGHPAGLHSFLVNDTFTLEINIIPREEISQDYYINNQLGDINGDGSIDVLDIVLTVNIVFNNNYNYSADLNQDQLINIQDIVLLVNLILN